MHYNKVHADQAPTLRNIRHSVQPLSDPDDPPTPSSSKVGPQEDLCRRLEEKLATIQTEKRSALQMLEERIRSEREAISMRYDEKIDHISKTIELLEEDCE